MNGIFLAFEGIDGSGKRTACHYSKDILEEKGLKTAQYQYPDYQSPWGRIIEEFLSGVRELDVEIQFLTYATDIAKDQRKIKEQLKNGYIIVADRYIISTVAFQCARGFDLEKALKFVDLFEYVLPDIVFYLNVAPERGMLRKKGQKGDLDRHEADMQFLEKVNNMYQLLYSKRVLARKWVEIDADKELSEVRSKITSEIERF